MKTRLSSIFYLLLKTIGFFGLFILITRWIYTCKGTSPLVLIPLDQYIALQSYFGVTCCESAADFDLNLSMLIALPLASLIFLLLLHGVRTIQRKRNPLK